MYLLQPALSFSSALYIHVAISRVVDKLSEYLYIHVAISRVVDKLSEYLYIMSCVLSFNSCALPVLSFPSFKICALPVLKEYFSPSCK